MYIRAPSGTLRLQGAEIKKAEDLKYLESTGHVEWKNVTKGLKWQKRMQGTTAEVSRLMDQCVETLTLF